MTASLKHTPGPWEIRRIGGIPGSVIGGVARNYSRGTSPDQLFMVCSVQDENGGRAAMEANASLIAAAPDLLAALREIIAINDEDQGTFRKRGGTRRGLSIVAAREAIAKATGAPL